MILFSPVALCTDFTTCQTPNDAAPLTGCPDGTLFVSISSPLANYTKIQDAVLALPNDASPAIILIDAGSYTEQVNVTRLGPTTLLGKTTRTNDVASNLVSVTWSAANPNSTVYPDNSYTATLTIASDLDAAETGSGPSGFPVPDGTPLGSADFKAYNLNFTNDFLPYAAGPALTLSASRANTSFYHVYFGSYQDTIYVGKLGNAYMSSSIIGGQTDFLYGFGTLYITNSTLQLRGCGGGITAWKGSNTTFVNKYGVYISGSQALAENATVAQTFAGKCALGRPWNSQHRSIFFDNYLDDTINPAGYIQWEGHPIIAGKSFLVLSCWSVFRECVADCHAGQTFLGEYQDFGPGFNLTAREAGNVTMELTDNEAATYRWPKDVFLNPDGSTNDLSWIDADYLVP